MFPVALRDRFPRTLGARLHNERKRKQQLIDISMFAVFSIVYHVSPYFSCSIHIKNHYI